MLRVRPPEAVATPESFEIDVTCDAGKLISDPRNDVWLNFVPGVRLAKLTRWLPFSFWIWARSVAESWGGPPFELVEPEVVSANGRVTDMSVPTPVSGF